MRKNCNAILYLENNAALVEGCSDPDLPAAMWMRRDAHEALVACRVDTPTRWILKCVNGKWEGQVGICPAIPALSGSASASSSLQSYVGQSLPAKTPISYQDNGIYRVFMVLHNHGIP